MSERGPVSLGVVALGSALVALAVFSASGQRSAVAAVGLAVVAAGVAALGRPILGVLGAYAAYLLVLSGLDRQAIGGLPAPRDRLVAAAFAVGAPAVAALVWSMRRAGQRASTEAAQARDSETFHASLARSIPLGVAVFDDSLRCVFANHALSDHDAVEPEKRVGRPVSDALAWLPEDVLRSLRLALASGDTVPPFEAGFSTQGHDRVGLFTAQPVAGTGRWPAGVSLGIVDVTPTAAAARLAESDRLLARQLASAASALYSERDPAWLARRVCEAAVRLTGADSASCTVQVRPGLETSAVAGRTREGRHHDLTLDLGGMGEIVVRRRVGPFTQSEHDILHQLAGHAAGAIDNLAAIDEQSLTREAAERAGRRLGIAGDAARAATSSLDLDEVVARIAKTVVPTLGDVCLIDLVGPSSVRRVAATMDPLLEGLVDLRAAPGARERYPFADAAESLRPVRREDPTCVLPRTPPDPSFPENAKLADPLSAVAAPFTVDDEQTGVVVVVTTASSGRTMDDEDMAVVADLAEAAGAAVRNAISHADQRRAHARAAEQAWRLEALLRAGELLSEAPDLESTLENAARAGLEMADICLVDYVRDDGSLRRAAAARDGFEDALDLSLPDMATPPGGGVVAWLGSEAVRLATGPEVSRFVAAAARTDHEAVLLRKLSIESVIATSLPGRLRRIGAMCLIAVDEPHTAEDLPWASQLASRGATALDNSLLYERQRHVADNMQRTLLPERPSDREGMSIAARYLPAGDGADVGGDWYDVVPLPSGVTGIVVGDVMGRGVNAASAMAQLRFAVRAFAIEGHSPATVLTWLNRLVLERLPEQMATIVYATVDPANSRLRLCSAGHPPPLLAYPDGSVVLLDRGRGLALGVSADAEYGEASLTLPAGSTLLLYTDGLVENRQDVSEEATRRLRESLRDSAGKIDLMCDRLIVRGLEGRKLDDDVALVVVEIHGQEGGQ